MKWIGRTDESTPFSSLAPEIISYLFFALSLMNIVVWVIEMVYLAIALFSDDLYMYFVKRERVICLVNIWWDSSQMIIALILEDFTASVCFSDKTSKNIGTVTLSILKLYSHLLWFETSIKFCEIKCVLGFSKEIKNRFYITIMKIGNILTHTQSYQRYKI